MKTDPITQRAAANSYGQSNPGSRTGLISRRLCDITARPIQWLWPSHIAQGKVSLIVGHPGLGKSQLTASIAAIVSSGGEWPVTGERTKTGRVLVLSAEDDPEDTIRPRMEAAGADLERIEVIDAVRSEDGQTDLFSLRSHVEQLAGRVLEKGDVSLVIIDPVTAYLEGSDSHKNADVRALFKPLSKMASDTNTAIVCVSHLNKANGGSALLRVTGSLAFVAAARAAFLVALDQDDKDKRLFLPLKNNLSEASTGMAFYIRPMSLGNRIETSKVVWTNERVTITADEALNQQEMRVTRPIDDAAQFLFYFLGSGPKPMKEVLRRAENEGHTEITVKRAKKRLGVKSRKSGISDGWTWELPEGAIDSD